MNYQEMKDKFILDFNVSDVVRGIIPVFNNKILKHNKKTLSLIELNDYLEESIKEVFEK